MSCKPVYFFIVFLLLLLYCDYRDPLSIPTKVDEKIILFDAWNAVFLSNDAADILEGEIHDDLLKLKISYKGGCKDHVFGLFAKKGFMESYPVQMNLFLSHDAKEDMCRARIQSELCFDLSPLKKLYKTTYQTTGTILLRIHEPHDSEHFKLLVVYEF